MVQWQTALQGFKFFCLISVLWILASCKTSGGPDGCAGFEKIVSCVQIVNIAPQNSTGDNSSDVDAFQDLCEPGPPPVFEALTKHSAEITFSNDQLPTADGGLDILLTSYSITYRLINCPPGASGCPPLSSPPSQNINVLIPTGADVTTTVDFVPLDVKRQYRDAGGEDGDAAPLYEAHYVFRGGTRPFTAEVTISGNAEFHITNFNLCTQ